MVSKWDEMPPELLPKVFEHLPHSERTRAGFMCTSWRDAAVASNTFQHQGRPGKSLAAASELMQQLTSKVSRLQLLFPWRYKHQPLFLEQLPFVHLQELTITAAAEAPRKSWTSPVVPTRIVPPHVLASTHNTLTKLVLQGLKLATPQPAPARQQAVQQAAQQFLGELCSLTSLQHLDLDIRESHLPYDQLVQSVQPLQQLTYLDLGFDAAIPGWSTAQDALRCPPQALMLISTLTKLQALSFRHAYQATALDLPDDNDYLQGIEQLQGLTQLHLDLCGSSWRADSAQQLGVSQHSHTSIGQLTRLLHLSLRYCACDVAALDKLTALQYLALHSPQGADLPQLYGWLSRLQQLTSLSLSGKGVVPAAAARAGAPAGADAVPLAECAAITASSRLQRLDLSQAPVGTGWSNISPADRKLSQLHCLKLPKHIALKPEIQFKAVIMFPADTQAMTQCCTAFKVKLCLHAVGLSVGAWVGGGGTVCMCP